MEQGAGGQSAQETTNQVDPCIFKSAHVSMGNRVNKVKAQKDGGIESTSRNICLKNINSRLEIEIVCCLMKKEKWFFGGGNVQPAEIMPESTVNPMAKPKNELPAWGFVVAVCKTTVPRRNVQNHSIMTAPRPPVVTPGVMRKVSSRMAHWNRAAIKAARIWTSM